VSDPSGREDRAGFLRSLRRDRSDAFRKEIVPHFRYVFQSGFGLFVSAIFFSVLVWYIDLIKAVPADWPVRTVGVVVLALAAIQVPLRTYLRPADTVFLLPMERRILAEYIGPALRKSVVNAVVRMLAVFAIYWPIYARSPITGDLEDSHPWPVIALLMALIAVCNTIGGWRERRPASRLWRLALRLVRMTLTVVVIAAILLKPLALAIPLLVVSTVLVGLLGRLPVQHALPWEKLIAEEEGTRRRWMSFLGWFVDVPTVDSKPARRAWVSWLGNSFLWRDRRAWHFLYAKTFLRGETFGAWWRWTVMAGIILVVSGNVVADAVLFAIAILIGELQLSELRRIRFVETAATLPIPPEDRLVAAAAIARAAGVAMVVLLGIIEVASSGMLPRLDIWLPLLVAGFLLSGWLMPRKIAKFKDEDDDL
jgi:ABC-2 type transport system permease protein